MTTPDRPQRRVRQACEPCRRKKSRCPGEKPICSHCARLNQRCTYAPDPARRTVSPLHRIHTGQTSPVIRHSPNGESSTAERLSTLEAQIAEMRNVFNYQSQSTGNASIHSSPRATAPQRILDPSVRATPSSQRMPSWEKITSAADLYLTYSNCQPLPLFSPQYLMETLASRDDELLLSILAVAARFSPPDGPASDAIDSPTSEESADKAGKLVMRRVSQGPVELSTIQSLCILSLREFNHGNTVRASLYRSLAMDLSQSSGLTSEYSRHVLDYAVEERRRCYWSVVLLQNLYSYPAGSFAFVVDERIPKIPQSPDQPLGTSSEITDASLEQPQSNGSSNEPSDLGIVAYAIQLSEQWQRAARYAHRRGKSITLPAWSAQSEYAQITAQLMEIETKMPYKYRFRPSRFTEQQPQHLRRNRAFWAPWLLVQLLYHSTLCLLNHPLLLSLRLRNFRVTMVPEIFLQHTADLTATHTEWIVHLLDLCREKDFKLSDPFLIHCAAIAATIYLQQSFTDDHTVRAEKQDCFKKCFSFIREMGQYWPYGSQLADKIEQFEKVVSTSFDNSAASNSPNPNIFIDLSLFWEIIESSSSSELPRTADSYFGASLIWHRQNPHSAEVLRSRLLPEPTRISHDGVTPSVSNTRSAGAMSRLPSFAPSVSQLQVPHLESSQEEGLSILAQSYFAAGQDFVGNMDDWWFSGPTV